ncbi:hypothetical protein COLO4_09074 [Corchorus olitorius]|uniref:DUF6737 domain-containing protein n=1 Tax=Corchorus olitorius TaxID=93759 RepID=A0A1R3KD91_9ROSI|nr:hypothetical protein COLO4_09074 [Corchorus olitorius]
MGTLSSLFPLSLSSASKPVHYSASKPLYNNNPISIPNSSSKLRSKTVAFGGNPTDPKQNEYSRFLDENGVVDDMDGYLNYLSLEYDSVWDTKPSWCQPWTITLTGLLVIASSWLIFHSIVITAVATFGICTWCQAVFENKDWVVETRDNITRFSLEAYLDMIAERREKVTNGVEDTFGMRKNQ